MNKKIVALAFLAALFVPAMLLAQDVPVPPPDWSAMLVTVIGAIESALIVLVVYGARLVMPKVPRIVLPLLAYALGFVAQYLTTLATGGAYDPIIAALIGTGAHCLNEIVTTLQAHGLSA